MPNFIYAVFKAPSEAETMSAEMVELGARTQDVAVIAHPSIENPDPFPGDLIGRLTHVGIGEAIAGDLKKIVLAGGAVLISATPTGDIDGTQAWRLISRCGGTQMGRSETASTLN